MKTRTKIAAATVAGIIAGATLMGAAFAAPSAVTGGFRMMGAAVTSASSGIPTFADMQAFMDRYRTSSGGLDVNRMHADVTSGKVTPPCLGGARTGAGASSAPSPQSSPQSGYGMMRTPF